MSDNDRPQLGGWDQHQADQRRAWLRLSYAQRLAWLEQAKAFVATVRASAGPRPARDNDQTPASLGRVK